MEAMGEEDGAGKVGGAGQEGDLGALGCFGRVCRVAHFVLLLEELY